MTYFRLGVKGEGGFFFFLPDSYRKPIKILGSGIRRTISGKAKRDIITTKTSFELGFEFLGEKEYLNLYKLFDENINKGKDLVFIDDEDGEYDVVWGSDTFGLDERIKNEEIHWAGTIFLEEI